MKNKVVDSQNKVADYKNKVMDSQNKVADSIAHMREILREHLTTLSEISRHFPLSKLSNFEGCAGYLVHLSEKLVVF
jgi:hypothetical protein